MRSNRIEHMNELGTTSRVQSTSKFYLHKCSAAAIFAFDNVVNQQLKIGKRLPPPPSSSSPWCTLRVISISPYRHHLSFSQSEQKQQDRPNVNPKWVGGMLQTAHRLQCEEKKCRVGKRDGKGSAENSTSSPIPHLSVSDYWWQQCEQKMNT